MSSESILSNKKKRISSRTRPVNKPLRGSQRRGRRNHALRRSQHQAFIGPNSSHPWNGCVVTPAQELQPFTPRKKLVKGKTPEIIPRAVPNAGSFSFLWQGIADKLDRPRFYPPCRLPQSKDIPRIGVIC